MNPDAIATAIRESLPAIGSQDAAALAQLLAALLADPSAAITHPAVAASLRTLVGQTLVIDGQPLCVVQSPGVIGNIDAVQHITIERGGAVHGDIIGTQIVITLPAGSLALRQLRAPVGDFVGREQEIDAIIAALRDTAAPHPGVVGICGMGGVGKTEIAFAVAQRLAISFPDAQIVLSLRGTGPEPLGPENALAQVIAALDPATTITSDLGQLQASYRAKLAGKRAIILADDARDAAQVQALLPPPCCLLLITSRNRFTLPGALQIDLDILPANQAELLLTRICPRVHTHAAALAALCGNLPLALRISASLLQSSPTLDPQRYVERLRGERLRHLADPDLPNAPQASVAASLRLSYNALPDAAQVALACLSVFRASFDTAAAQAVMASGDDGDDIIALLHRRSLITWDLDAKRIALHDLVREFAAAQPHDSLAARLRHAHHYRTVAQDANQLYREGGDSSIRGLEIFDRERTNIEQGWKWVIQQMEATPSRESDTLFLNYRFATRSLYALRYPSSVRLVELELQAARRIRDRYAESIALSDLADQHARLSEPQQAIKLYEQSLVAARSVNYHLGESIVTGKLALIYKDQGDYERATAYLQSGLAINRKHQHDPRSQRSMVAQRLELGGVYLEMGKNREALDSFEQALTLARSIGHLYGASRAHNAIGGLYASNGDHQRAIEHYTQMLDIVHELKDWVQVVDALTGMADSYTKLGDEEQARTYYQRAYEVDQLAASLRT